MIKALYLLPFALYLLFNSSRGYALTLPGRPDSLNVPVAAEMAEILQTYRINKSIFDLLARRYSKYSIVVTALQRQFAADDSVTLVKVLSIVNTWGWKGAAHYGEAGPWVLLITFMHASITTQKKYFAFLERAAKQGLLPPEGFAIIADQIALQETGYQIYGTQMRQPHGVSKIYEPLPIVNPDELNNRRGTLGLSSYDHYLLHYTPAMLERYCLYR
jgi:hypothetical protein